MFFRNFRLRAPPPFSMRSASHDMNTSCNNRRMYWCVGAALALHAVMLAPVFLSGHTALAKQQNVEVFLVSSQAQTPAPALTQASAAKAARARRTEPASPFVHTARASSSSMSPRPAELVPSRAQRSAETPEDADVDALNSTAGAPPAELPRRDPRYIDNQAGSYPKWSRLRGEEGTVRMRVYVKPDGRVADVVIVRSSGFADLDNDARRVVRGWRYLPARNGDTAVGAWAPIAYQFKLTDG